MSRLHPATQVPYCSTDNVFFRRFHDCPCKSVTRYKEKPHAGVRRAILLSEKFAEPTFGWLPVQLVDTPAIGEQDAASQTGSGSVVDFRSIAETSDGTVYSVNDFDLYAITAHKQSETPENLCNKCIDMLIGEKLDVRCVVRMRLWRQSKSRRTSSSSMLRREMSPWVFAE